MPKVGDVIWGKPCLEEWIDDLDSPTIEEITWKAFVVADEHGKLYAVDAERLAVQDLKIYLRNCEEYEDNPVAAIKSSVRSDLRLYPKWLERVAKALTACGCKELAEEVMACSKTIEGIIERV